MKEVKSLVKTTITIITPSYNRAGMITNAIESVLAQDFQNFEHIIVDGGSTDGTLEILKQYPHLKVISGSDRGMYDALNKGLQIAQSEIVGFLNTDDLYAENVFSAIVKEFDDRDIMAVTGRAIVFADLPDGNIQIVDTYDPRTRSLIESLTAGGAFFNAWFFRNSTFTRIGKFDPNYKIAGDQDFMFRFALSYLKYAMVDDLVYKYRMHADSLTFDKNSEKRTWSAEEHLTILNSHLEKQNLPELTRKLLIHVQTLETIDLVTRSIWMWNPKRTLHYIREGLKYNRAWPLEFFQYILRRGIVLLTRQFARCLR